jgi:hypothetical protein
MWVHCMGTTPPGDQVMGKSYMIGIFFDHAGFDTQMACLGQIGVEASCLVEIHPLSGSWMMC